MRDHDRRRIPLADLIDECLSGAECLFDPDLHEGPADTIELPTERDARETVAKEVCASCPALEDSATTDLCSATQPVMPSPIARRRFPRSAACGT